MAWLLGLVIIGGLVYLAYSSPEARKAVLIVLAVVVCGVAYLLYDEFTSEERAITLIAADEVELRGFAANTRTGLFYAKGSIKNLSSEHTLAFLEMRVRAHDCPTDQLEEACEIVGESVEKFKIEIPPEQVRGTERPIAISNLPTATNLVWSFDVVGVRAKVD